MLVHAFNLCFFLCAVPISIYILSLPLPYLPEGIHLSPFFLLGSIVLLVGLLLYNMPLTQKVKSEIDWPWSLLHHQLKISTLSSLKHCSSHIKGTIIGLIWIHLASYFCHSLGDPLPLISCMVELCNHNVRMVSKLYVCTLIVILEKIFWGKEYHNSAALFSFSYCVKNPSSSYT